MVSELHDGEDRPMTDTSHEQDEQTRTGVAAEHLRNYERLRRSVTERKVAGVAGGLGRHLNIDPTVLRVLFVVLAFFGGSGLVLYAAAWLIVPEEGSERSVISTTPSTRNALLIVVGVFAALLLLGDAWNGFGFPWPLLIVAVVGLVLLANRDGNRHQPATSDVEAAAGPVGQARPAEPPSGVGWAAPPAPYQPIPRPDRGAKLFGPTLALIALALGSLGLYDVSNPVVPGAYAALALAVVGVMLLVGAFAGRPGGLILLGVVAAIALAITSTVDGNWTSDRRIDVAPTSAAAVPDGYDLTAGQIRLDLTQVRDVGQLDGRTIALNAEAGEIVVIVPDDVDVDVAADIRFGGEADVNGYTQNGNGVVVDRHIDGGVDAPHVTLQLDLLVGRIEVRQENAA
jgi:phage shock protein PspC (stress-responsive transcriptional regulator)